MKKKILLALYVLGVCIVPQRAQGMAGRFRAATTRTWHSLKTVWNKTPQPVQAVAKYIVDNPFKCSLTGVAASQALLYQYVDREFLREEDFSLFKMPQQGELEIIFCGDTEQFTAKHQSHIALILGQCGVTGSVEVHVGSSQNYVSVPRLAVIGMDTADDRGKHLLVFDKSAFAVMVGVDTIPYLLHDQTIAARLKNYTPAHLMSVVFHEAKHIRTQDKKRFMALKQEKHKTVEVSFRYAAVGAFFSVMRHAQTLPHRIGRGVQMLGALYAVIMTTEKNCQILERLASHGKEKSADLFALYMMDDPQYMKDFKDYFERAAAYSPGGATHPLTRDRILLIEEALQKNAKSGADTCLQK